MDEIEIRRKKWKYIDEYKDVRGGEVIKHRHKEYERARFIFYFPTWSYLRSVTRGSSLAKTDFGLSHRLISYTNIHANLSICLQSFRHGRCSFSLSKASVLRPSFPRDVIRRKKKKEKGNERERKREREGKKKRKISLTWSRVMSMNFYIEMLSRIIALLPRRENKKEEIPRP